jgi:hypothetical protein
MFFGGTSRTCAAQYCFVLTCSVAVPVAILLFRIRRTSSLANGRAGLLAAQLLANAAIAVSRRPVAVRRDAVFVVAKGERPHPWPPDQRLGRLAGPATLNRRDGETKRWIALCGLRITHWISVRQGYKSPGPKVDLRFLDAAVSGSRSSRTRRQCRAGSVSPPRYRRCRRRDCPCATWRCRVRRARRQVSD